MNGRTDLAHRILRALAIATAWLAIGSIVPTGTLVAQDAEHAAGRASETGSVRGFVRDTSGLGAIEDVHVTVMGSRFVASSHADGSFLIRAIPAGTYDLHLGRIGFQPVIIRHVAVRASDTTDLGSTSMVPTAVSLATVQVTPGSYGLMESTVGSRQTMSRQDIATKPQLGEDIFRAVNRLPGLSSTDISAKFTVRGGSVDEVLVTLDGAELYEPFHLKDIDAALSIVDVNAIGGIDLSTGGFSAESGNHLTGVFAMQSVEPTNGGSRTSVGLSVTNLRVSTQGTYDNGRLAWFVSARRGYLDLALKLTQSSDSLSPAFNDVFAKLEFNPSANHRLALHLLAANDQLRYLRQTDPSIDSRYGSNYQWATWDARFSDRIQASSVISLASLTWNRLGTQPGGDRTLNVADHRSFDAMSVRQDWSLSLSDRALLRVGAEGKRVSASYNYLSAIRRDDSASASQTDPSSVFDTTRTILSPAGSAIGAYLTQRVRVANFVADAGARIDRETYGSAETDVSPRAAIAWSPRQQTTVRAAWGRYVQPQPIYGLQVQDGVDRFFPASIAEQRVMGIEEHVGEAVTGRIEMYDRRVSREHPVFVNALNGVDLLPEATGDRVRIDPARGDARGIEVSVAGQSRAGLGWTASYALARAIDRIGGVDVARAVDQRHSITIGSTYRSSTGRWLVSAGWLYDSGRPYTPERLVVDTTSSVGPDGSMTRQIAVHTVLGALNSLRLPAYQRLDLRATRYFDLGRQRLMMYADVFNALNHVNPRGYLYDVQSSPPQLFRRINSQIPVLPTVGITWEF